MSKQCFVRGAGGELAVIRINPFITQRHIVPSKDIAGIDRDNPQQSRVSDEERTCRQSRHRHQNRELQQDSEQYETTWFYWPALKHDSLLSGSASRRQRQT